MTWKNNEAHLTALGSNVELSYHIVDDRLYFCVSPCEHFPSHDIIIARGSIKYLRATAKKHALKIKESFTI